MPDNKNKRCPQCGGGIDIFGTCRRCGREWSEELEEDELAEGLPEGQQHPPEVKQVGTHKPRRNRFTKSKSADKHSLWQIDASDDETEIIRKRSLMRLDSRRIYTALGSALQAHRAQKAALLWLSRLWESSPEDERKQLAPTIERLKQGFADICRVMQEKSTETAQMEVALEKAHQSARTARIRLLGEEVKRRAAEESRSKTKQIDPHEDTEGFGVPDTVTLDPKVLEQLTPEDLLELAKAKLANLDQEKALKKTGKY